MGGGKAGSLGSSSVGAAADTLLDALGTMGEAAVEESIMVFESLGKKRWIEHRALLNQNFMENAPQELKSFLEQYRDLYYDYSKPLNKLRNQIFANYKTLLK